MVKSSELSIFGFPVEHEEATLWSNNRTSWCCRVHGGPKLPHLRGFRFVSFGGEPARPFEFHRLLAAENLRPPLAELNTGPWLRHVARGVWLRRRHKLRVPKEALGFTTGDSRKYPSKWSVDITCYIKMLMYYGAKLKFIEWPMGMAGCSLPKMVAIPSLKQGLRMSAYFVATFGKREKAMM